MNTKTRRIAINVGGGFVPGMNAVVAGAALAAGELGWELVGIRHGAALELSSARCPALVSPLPCRLSCEIELPQSHSVPPF